MNTSRTEFAAYEIDNTRQFRSGDWMTEKRRREYDLGGLTGIILSIGAAAALIYSAFHPLIAQVQTAIEGVLR